MTRKNCQKKTSETLSNQKIFQVLCAGEEIQKETDIYRFCAEFMEKLLAQRDPKQRPKMIPSNTQSAQDQNDSFPSYNREGTFHLTNTDSGTFLIGTNGLDLRA